MTGDRVSHKYTHFRCSPTNSIDRVTDVKGKKDYTITAVCVYSALSTPIGNSVVSVVCAILFGQSPKSNSNNLDSTTTTTKSSKGLRMRQGCTRTRQQKRVTRAKLLLSSHSIRLCVNRKARQYKHSILFGTTHTHAMPFIHNVTDR